MRQLMARLKLTVNEMKTRTCRVPQETVRLSGLHLRPVLLGQDGPSLLGHASVEEEYRPPDRFDQERKPTAGRFGLRPRTWWRS